MKRKILSVVLALIITLSLVGAWYYTSYPTISVGKFVATSSENFEKEFYSETLSISSAVIDFIPDSPLQKRKTEEVRAWNEPITKELLEHSKEGGIAYNITVSGEIENGQTTLRYEGYIVKKDGERTDYKKEKTFNFVLCSEKRFFTDML